LKRKQFQSAAELTAYCQENQITLSVEFMDEQRKLRQVVLSPDESSQLEAYLHKPGVFVYFRQDGIIFEVVAAWL
jgi:hypothetical protein